MHLLLYGDAFFFMLFSQARVSHRIRVQYIDNRIHFCIGECLVEWNAQFLCVNAFSHRVCTVVPLLVSTLLMRRNRIMNDGLDAMLQQILL